MPIGVLLIILGVVLFAGMVVALAFGAIDVMRADAAEAAARLSAGETEVFHDESTPVSGDNIIMFLEHHVRRERLRASRFVDDPVGDSLFARRSKKHAQV